MQEVMRYIEESLRGALRGTGFGAFVVRYQTDDEDEYRITVEGTLSEVFKVSRREAQKQLRNKTGALAKSRLDELLDHIEQTLSHALTRSTFGTFGVEYSIHRSNKFRIIFRGTESRVFYVSMDEIAEEAKEA